jgi:hypothetical protein
VIPTISSIAPTSGPIGTVVTIGGTGLMQTTKVSFGGVNAATFAVNSDSKVSDQNTVQTGPVLLIDDMADSRWTFTVLGFKLRQAGSGPVFPFALADTSAEGGD